MNEDLAATSVFGSQISHVLGESKFDGVVGIWYGKGPGRRPLRRYLPPRQPGRHRQQLRRAGAGRRRSYLAKAPPSRIRAISASTTSAFRSSIRATRRRFSTTACWRSRCRASPAPGSAMKMVTDVCDGGGTVDARSGRSPQIRIPEGYEKNVDARLVVPFTLALEHEVNCAPARGRARVRARSTA